MANLYEKALKQSTCEILRWFVSHGPQFVSNQLFESELLSDQRYNQVCEEKIPERQAVIMATGLREKMRAEEKSFQKFVNVLEKKLDLKPLAKFLQGKLASCSSDGLHGMDVDTDSVTKDEESDRSGKSSHSRFHTKDYKECNEEWVKKVIRQVTLDNLAKLQQLLIVHEDGQNIIAYIGTRSTYHAQHDFTVYYWFRLEPNPTWDKLTAYLKDCNENGLASRIESGEVFGDPDPSKLPSIHSPETQDDVSCLSLDLEEEKPRVKSKTKEGRAIITKNFQRLQAAFKKLKHKLCQFLRERNVTYERFLSCANTYFPRHVQYGIKNIEAYIANAEALGELGLFRHDYLLDTMKLIFDQDEEEEEEEVDMLFDEYEDEKDNYYTVTKIIEFLVSKDKEHLLRPGELRKQFNVQNEKAYYKLGMKLEQPIEEKNLKYVDKLWKSMRPMFVTPAKAVLQYIYKSCIEVTWEVSSHDMMYFNIDELKNRRRNLQKAKIRTVWLNGEVLYHEDDHIGKNKMKAQLSLWEACHRGKIFEVGAMLDVPDIDVNLPSVIDGKTPLMLAAEIGSLEVVSILLNNKAALPNITEEKSGRSALFYAAENGHIEVVKEILKKKGQHSVNRQEWSFNTRHHSRII